MSEWEGRVCVLVGHEHSKDRRAHDRRGNPTKDNQVPGRGERAHYGFLRRKQDDHDHQRHCDDAIDDGAPEQGFHRTDR